VEDQARFRLGFTASRKVGGAVVRNRARRRLRAAAAAVMAAHAAYGMDYVLVCARGNRETALSEPVGRSGDSIEAAADVAERR
jgi:ribonuclease P protein component